MSCLRRLAGLFVPLSMFLVAACDDEDCGPAVGACGGITCTASAVPSTNVFVVDAEGAAVVDPDLVYSAHGRPFVPCDFIETVAVCGWESRDTILLHVEAEGFEPLDVSVVVGGDECHPDTETVTLTLVRAVD